MAPTPDQEERSYPLMENAPPFYHVLHARYITGLEAKLDNPSSFEGALTAHLRMSGVYWSVTALSILQNSSQVDQNMGLTQSEGAERPSIVDWVFDCWDEERGAFGGNKGQDGHVLYTLSALQILAIADRLEDSRLQKEKIVCFLTERQQPDGSFTGDSSGEIDTRFTYCVLSSLAVLNSLEAVNVSKAMDYIISCVNVDGGFGTMVGAESHAGQVFCCIGALSIGKALDRIDADLLGWWLCERQVDSGGLNGRPEKQADVCYSWWILSSLSILGRLGWVNRAKLAGFILRCQDDEDGGIADRPDDMADVFHTFFGIAGLSLLGYLHSAADLPAYRTIDPVYALPTDVVLRLGLPGQALHPPPTSEETVDERLSTYVT